MTEVNKSAARRRTGGDVLVEALCTHGVKTVFYVPGESVLPVVDAMYRRQDDIRLITCRQEGGAGNMAEAHGKLTGKPGVVLVNRALGATNVSIAVHTAAQDSTPLIVLVGQVSQRAIGRDAWQETDYEAFFGRMAKLVIQVNMAERIPEAMSRAFHTAVAGRAGPVVIAIPEEFLYDDVVTEDAPAYTPVRTFPGSDAMASLARLIAASRKPLMVLGGSGWNRAACDKMQDFAARFRLPAATGFRRQDLFDNCHDSFVGDLGLGVNPFLAQRVRDADLIIAIGSRLSEATTSEYELVKIPRPVQKLIHVHADSHELGRVYQADLLVHSDMQGFADAIEHLAPDTQPAWGEWTDAARADYLDTLEHGPMVGRFDLGAMFDYLRIRVPADAILTNGAGNYASWLHRFYQYRGFRTQLAPASGAMGYGVPAAIAAKLECPDRLVICFAGDGCFLMNDQELATAKHLGLRIIFIVVNNGMYGTVRMVQEISYPRNVYGSDLANPDFAMIGQAYGFYNAIVERTEDFAQAFEAALAAPTSSVLELRVDPESISPRTSISALQRRKPLS